MGLTLKDGNKRPWRPQTKTSIWNFTVTGMSCLEPGRTNFGYRKCTAKNNSNPSLAMFELDCDSQLNNSPSPTFWCLHELNVFARKNSRNGFLRQTCHINLFSAVHHILRTWKHGADIERWKQTALETTNQNIYLKLHCDRHELPGTREDKFWVQKMYGEK